MWQCAIETPLLNTAWHILWSLWYYNWTVTIFTLIYETNKYFFIMFSTFFHSFGFEWVGKWVWCNLSIFFSSIFSFSWFFISFFSWKSKLTVGGLNDICSCSCVCVCGPCKRGALCRGPSLPGVWFISVPSCERMGRVSPEQSNGQAPDAGSQHSKGRPNVFNAAKEALEGPLRPAW